MPSDPPLAFFDSSQARLPPPSDLRWLNRQGEVRPAFEQCLESASAFDAGELMAEAKMNARSERDVPVRPSLEIEPLGALVRSRVEVGGREHGHDLVVLS